MTVNLARAIQLFARWHRRIGITVAVWLILLSISGVLINHANDWGLDQKALPQTIQAAFYPMTLATETEPAAFISWERLILDIHAARFLGSTGLWFSDLLQNPDSITEG